MGVLTKSSRPRITVSVLPKVPATMVGTGGIAISKVNGVWTVGPRWTDLSLVSGGLSTKEVWVRDTVTNTYARMLASGIGGGSGSGDVVGPASSVDNQIALFSGVTGKLIKAAAISIVGSALMMPAQGSINFGSGQIVLSHQATGYQFAISGASASGTELVVQNTDPGVQGSTLHLYHNSASPAGSDQPGRMLMSGLNSAAAFTTYAQITAIIANATAGTEQANLIFAIQAGGGTFKNLTLSASTSALGPNSNDELALGTPTISWADAHFASGAVIGFANLDVTITHSANFLAFAGASNGYDFDRSLTCGGTTTALMASGRTFVIDGTNSSALQPCMAFYMPGSLSGQKSFGFVYDDGSHLTPTTAPALIIQNLSDTGGFVGNSTAFYRDGSVCFGGINYPGAGGCIKAMGTLAAKNPGQIATNFTLTDTDSTLICAGSATITLTLPSAGATAAAGGRLLFVKTTTAFTVISASANVVPIGGGAAGTAILAATVGKWAILQADGALGVWQIIAAN